MKHKQLHAVAHNYADSLASGLGFVVGHFETDVFADAARSPERQLTIDFLSGTIPQGAALDSTLLAIEVYQREFSAFCQKNGASRDQFAEFVVQFTATQPHNKFCVTIKDAQGRRSKVDYVGSPGRRQKTLDDLGRIIPKKVT